MIKIWLTHEDGDVEHGPKVENMVQVKQYVDSKKNDSYFLRNYTMIWALQDKKIKWVGGHNDCWHPKAWDRICNLLGYKPESR